MMAFAHWLKGQNKGTKRMFFLLFSFMVTVIVFWLFWVSRMPFSYPSVPTLSYSNWSQKSFLQQKIDQIIFSSESHKKNFVQRYNICLKVEDKPQWYSEIDPKLIPRGSKMIHFSEPYYYSTDVCSMGHVPTDYAQYFSRAVYGQEPVHLILRHDCHHRDPKAIPFDRFRSFYMNSLQYILDSYVKAIEYYTKTQVNVIFPEEVVHDYHCFSELITRHEDKTQFTNSTVASLYRNFAHEYFNITAKPHQRPYKVTFVERTHKRRILMLDHLLENVRDEFKEGEIVQAVSVNLGGEDGFPLGFMDIVRLFSTSDIVVAGHGAAIGNAIYSSPGTHLVELFPDGFHWKLFQPLVEANGLYYHSIDSRSRPEPCGVEAINGALGCRDHDIDIEWAVLRNTLKNAITSLDYKNTPQVFEPR